MNLIGQVINGYKLIKFLGQGGFGSVYRATKGDDDFAIKIFREAYVLTEFQKSDDNRITREIKVMQSINHPTLVDYKDHFFIRILDVPHVFLVMEFIDGETLRNAMSKLKEDLHIPIFLKILEGVKALHTENIIHRDLKPENIFITKDGRVKILDYGLAKIIDYTSITSTGNILGTYAYMSPEQITDSKNIDFRSDLYSLGTILYEIVTLNRPFEARLVPEFIDKIKNEPPTPPRRWNKEIPNHIENSILKLLEKEPFRRYNDIIDLIDSLKQPITTVELDSDLTPRFILRTYDEKSILEQYYKDHPENKLFVNYPINHQFRQKGLLELLKKNNAVIMFDPSTIRLAYDTYTENKGLQQLPYCPKDYSVINPSYLSSTQKQKEYVKLVIDEQLNLGVDVLTSPYHYAHNTNVLPTARRNPVAEWFDLDVKLLKESLDYKNHLNGGSKTPLYAGICINSLSLSDVQYRNELLDIYTASKADGFVVYADGINKESSEGTLYHYISTLVELQIYSNKPVIAGRLDSLGLGLLCAGISGFTSGAARFESFYEDLYKDTGPAYNMYERYYFPELLGTIAITRKDPIRLQQINNVLGHCNCMYCKNKLIPDIIKSQNAKLHFLEQIHKEIRLINNLEKRERIDYFVSRIETAISKYSELTMVFKPNDYRHLSIWKKVFSKISEKYV